MRYYAQYNGNGELLAIGTGCGGTEIAENEYNALMTEIQTKAKYVQKVYSSEMTVDDVPAEWQEEIQQRVDRRIDREEAIKAMAT